MTDYSGIPELAGIATYESAARVGFSVDDNVVRLLRLHWAERRLMRTLIAHIPATPVWEVKCALALHQWYCAQHADALRRRITELRNPAPTLDSPPAEALEAFFAELERAGNTAELVGGIYGIALPALRDACASHLEKTNSLVDHPTCRIARLALLDLDETIGWGNAAIAALGASQPTTAWTEHLSAYLAEAGGVSGDAAAPATTAPPPRAVGEFKPDMHPRRDERFTGSYNFNFPPHVVYNAPDVPADERNLALLCKRALEMDVPEMMASFMTERDDQPWEFYLDYSRQLWDEARHAMMGTVALTARGVDWTRIPLNVGFSLRLNLHATALERQILLYGIEQSLMPGDVGKRSEYETAVAAGDALSAHFHDYDWADEVLHAHIGRRALKRDGISREDAMRRADEIHERTWKELDRYKDRQPQDNWWPEFVRRVLGEDSSALQLPTDDVRVLSG